MSALTVLCLLLRHNPKQNGTGFINPRESPDDGSAVNMTPSFSWISLVFSMCISLVKVFGKIPGKSLKDLNDARQ